MSEQKKRTVALCGFAPMTRGLAPVNDLSVEIWTLNEAKMMGFTRINRLYQLHPRFMWDPNPRDPGYVDWLRAQDCPVFLWEKEPDIPNSERYPIERLTEKFGPYFTSTFSFMLAQAIDEGYDRIEIYGIDLVAEEEYRYQRAGTEFLIGWAKAAGIDVYIPPDCPLLKAPLYGRYGPADAKTLWTEEGINLRVAELNQQKAKLIADLNAIEGALQENQNWRHKHMRDKHTNNGLEHEAKVFAGQTMVNGQMVQSDGTGAHEHTGLLEEVTV